jgi:hypothetical protein
MAQKKKKKKTQKIESPSAKKLNLSSSYFSKHPNVLPLLILVILLLIFFNQVMLSGKSLLPPDKITSISYESFMEKSAADGDYQPQWYPYIFGGMPLFASLTRAPYVDISTLIINKIIWLISLIFPLPTFTILFVNYILFGIFTYILLQHKTKVRIIALFAALAMVFQPGIIAFAAFGHSSKLMAAIMIPIIFLLVEEVLEKRKIFYVSLLALAIGTQLLRKMPQMSYYTFMMVGLFLIYWIVEGFIQKKSAVAIFKSVGFVVVALTIGAMMSSWMYLSVQEYAQYSIRGAGGGLDYNYASSWSFSPLEVMTFFIPSFVGFGGQTYWGNMPFTDYPMYMGIVTLFLAGLAFVIRKERTVWFLGLLAFLALLVSFGKELPILYNLLFKYAPFFNKFRIPTMILILVQFSVVFLASLALHSLWKVREKEISEQFIKRIKYYIYGFCGFVCLIFLYMLIGKSSILARMLESANFRQIVNGYGAQAAQQMQTQSYDMAMNDTVLMVVFLAITIVLLLAYLKRKFKVQSFLYSITALTVINLWFVDFKITDYQPKANRAGFFREDEVIKFLKKDESDYRIMALRFSANEKPDNWYGHHFIQNMFGYHPAKLKIYQELMEQAGFINNTQSFLMKYFKPVMQDGKQVTANRAPAEIDPSTWNFHQNLLRMLNVKYVVSPYAFSDSSYQMVLNGKNKVFQHNAVLPRAFFVNEVRKVDSKEELFAQLKQSGFNPAETALVYQDIPVNISSGISNSVSETKWDVHRIELNGSAQEPGFLVLSEVYYPPGWKAKLNDQPVETYQTNHVLRGVFVPKGEFNLTFEYDSTRFKLGFFITAFLIVGCLALVFIQYRKIRKEE